MKSVNKTVKTKRSPAEFFEKLEKNRQADCKAIAAMMRNATGAPPRMWGPSIVGFGDYHYKYDTGREADWFEVGFSPRKANLTLYIMSGVKKYPELLDKLGKHSTSVSCLYIKRLSDVDVPTLEKLIKVGVKDIRAIAAQKKK